MHFCSQCQNMYYIRMDSDNPNILFYYCRNCGNDEKFLDVETNDPTESSVCVSKTLIQKEQQSFHHIINKYTKLDPTLPRTSKILCPNAECKTNKNDEKREIIYIRYDDINIKYIYLCSSCDTTWKSFEEK
jgi:DNA-directed RNA polymerase subunit M/transcription elongation factor TFIIS